MGEVYAAFDETLKRRVALKSIRADHRWRDEAKARFLREARLLSQLDHPNVCRVYDYIDDGHQEWLVLELIEGANLRELLRKGLETSRRTRIAEQIAAVLVATHAAGVIHRDLKPANVMVTSAGEVKVLDFGLAQPILADRPPIADAAPSAEAVPASVPADSDATTYVPPISSAPADDAMAQVSVFRTQKGALSGTVAYMSPEQAMGEPATTASDMYSFGLLLQELFTGRRPYQQGLEAAELLERVRRADTLPPDGVSADIASLIRRLKSLAPSQRPTAVETLERLRWIRAKPARRLRRAIAVAVVAAALLGVAKYTLDLARERAVAIAAQGEADQRRKQAEALIGFMLGNLQTKLQQVGRLDLLEDVGREATAYFKAVPTEALTNEELYRRSQSLYQIGQVYQAKGNLPQAIDAYRDSLALILEVSTRAPDNAEWQLGLGTAHFYLGDALLRQGNLDDALAQFRSYGQVAEQLVAKSPQKPEWRLEAAYGHSNVAAVLEAKGDFGGALAELQISLPLIREVSASAPENVPWRRSLANQHNRIGVVLQRLGRLLDARDHYQQDLTIEQELLAQQPQNAQLLARTAVAHSWLATVLEDMGDGEAKRHRRAQFDIMTALTTRDSANTDWQRELAMARLRMGDENALDGQSNAALSRYRESFAALASLYEKNPSRLTLRRDVAGAHARLARLSLKSRHAAPAASDARACLKLLSPVVTGPTADYESQIVWFQCALTLGAALALDRRHDEAVKEWRRALETIEPLAKSSSDPRRLQWYARVLDYLGRKEESTAVVKRLLSAGYRNPMFLDDIGLNPPRS